MPVPDSGFAILIERERTERRQTASGYRYRTVGRYTCYLDGAVVQNNSLRGASVEPNGPGNNGKTGVNRGRRIEAGIYPLGTHGFAGSKYHTFDYNNDKAPWPGIYVHDTGERSAILIHRGVGFKATVGCINLTGSIVGPNDNISSQVSVGRLDALIEYMKGTIPNFPSKPGRRIGGAWLVVHGEP